ncbi:hypothetical protein [uncultured Hymenobacter sp.]|uniref:hypothetical protein n=1 Tax=uncultured Hymenobacter sp. TaxID=170016 RepID=UPI0035CBB6A7
MNRTFWLLRGLRFALFGALFLALAGFGTMSLWNWLVPALFHGPLISLPQTFGLLVLSRILFGGFGGGSRAGAWARQRRAWQQRLAGRLDSLSPEQQEQFRQQMHSRCSMGWKQAASAVAKEQAQPA